MKRRSLLWLLACVVTVFVMGCTSLSAQTEAKEKAPMYSYVSNWAMPRAQWAAYEKDTSTEAILQKALANGTIIGYGKEHMIIHNSEGWTHDSWWSSNSMAGVLNVLDQVYASGGGTTNLLGASTKHEDELYVAHYYNYKPGSWKGMYGHAGFYKLKADAPDNAIALLSKEVFVPFFEKLMADGTIMEYEIDEQAIHTNSPDTFMLYYLCANAEGLDKVNAALAAWQKSSPIGGVSFGSMTDQSAHRDELLRSDVTYK